VNDSRQGGTGESFSDDPRPIDGICDEFEKLWKSGQKPRIRKFIEEASIDLREPLFRELLSIEVEYRRAAANPPSRTQYKSEFPEYGAIIDAVFDNSFREEGPASTLGPGNTPVAEPPDISELSKRYKIKELVGRGGMGWVYHARRKQFDMDVALKIVSPDFMERFQIEAEVLVRLRSPHIVTIHDYEVLSNGTPVLVMEWVDGGDLSQCMRANGGHLKEHVALPWMRQTCEGMRAVSGQGVVHRDLKPSNIMITKDGVVKVADFGMARVPRPSPLSRAGQIMGTISYISPEQATAPQSVDRRADIYSFGACFYHALTGVPPFSGDTDISIILKHASEPLVAPKARNPEISEATSQLLERCLAKSPAERFQSFDEVLNYLETTPWDRLDDDDELSELVGLYQSRRNEYLDRRRAIDEADVYALPNGRELRIQVGKIESQQSDAIVSSDDWLVSMRDGVAKDILQAAGPEIKDELACVPIRPGRALVTSAGSLKARRIFHGVTFSGGPNALRPSHDVISQVMDSCFYHADSHYVTSIAFPLLGAGPGGFSEESCLDTMFRFLARNLLRRATAISQATIVLKPNLQVAFDGSKASQVAKPKLLTMELPEPSNETEVVALRGYELFHHYEQARYARSDLLAIVTLPDSRVAVVVADVMGHGIGGSVVIEAISAEIEQLLASETSLEDILRQLNRKVLELEATGRFVTFAAMMLDPRTHEVTMVNAGHPPPLKRSVDGHVTKEGLDCVDLPLGVQKDIDYQPHVIRLDKGESLTIAANGILDAMNSFGESFNEGRFLQLIAQGRSVNEIGQSIIDDVRQFQGDSPPVTDWCLACIGRT
jgi:serine/threonine protein kinase